MTAKQASERKIEANRRNAGRSSGPKTPKGKSSSCRNALKHGAYAQEILPGERRTDRMTLIRRLVDDLDVRTEIELEIVQALASCLWRVRRLARAEVFEISRLVEDQAQYSAIMAGGDEDDDVKPESRDVDAVMAKHIAGYKNEVFEGARDRL